LEAERLKIKIITHFYKLKGYSTLKNLLSEKVKKGTLDQGVIENEK